MPVYNRHHSITADVEYSAGDQGVLLCQGDGTGGYSLFVLDGKLNYVHNYVGTAEYRVESNSAVPEGRVSLRYEFEPSGEAEPQNGKGTPGPGQLYVHGELVGHTEIPMTVPFTFSASGGLTVGRDPGQSVTKLYQAPFEFTGTIHNVIVEVSGELIEDSEAKIREVMARQ